LNATTTAPARTARPVRRATDPQIAAVKREIGRRDLTGASVGLMALTTAPETIDDLTFTHARLALDFLFGASLLPQPAVEQVTEGIYLREGVVYKVQAARGLGNLYAKVLEGKRFEYAAGAIRDLRPEHKMTLEQAEEYGARYGVCCQCGRTLTKKESVDAGIGPICAGKF